MSRLFCLSAILLILLALPARAQSPDTSAISHPDLRQELLAMEQKDQAIRQRVIAAQQSGESEPAELMARMDSLDRSHADRLKAIVDEHGWPHPSQVGPDAVNAAFLIVQHATHDPAFQERSLDSLRAAFEDGAATGQQVALLTDRVRVQQGKPQLYGTQALIQDSTIVFRPIADSTNVDVRRKELGMMPLDEYAQMLRKFYLSSENGRP
jgi:hypothetical protein